MDDEAQLFEHHRRTVNRGQGALRIDKYLTSFFEKVSRNRVQQAARAGCILVNDKPVSANYKVRPGDEITIMLPRPPQRYELKPEAIPLNIVYEDDDLLVVDKPARLGRASRIGQLHGNVGERLAPPLSTITPQSARGHFD